MKALALLLVVVLAVTLVAPRAADAQPGRPVPRIGLLANNPSPYLDVLLQALRDLGYVDGQTVVIERRNANARSERLPALAAQLVARHVELIVAPDPPSARAASGATKTIPIVIRSSDDPVEEGLVASLARPGGNVTGLYSLYAELGPKRLELFREALPGLTRVGVLWNPEHPYAAVRLQELQAAARALGVQLLPLDARRAEDLDAAFRAAVRERVGGVMTLRNPLIVTNMRRIVALASAAGLPTMYDERAFVEAGGFMSYGAHLGDLYRRAAGYVDKILKGAKAAELPVEQPTRFELVINLKTAKTLGLTIPGSLLSRADQIIQ